MAARGKMLTVVFRDRVQATEAYDWLQDRGYSADEINVLMSDRTRETFGMWSTEGKMTRGSKAAEGMATGGAIGTAVGATLAAVAAIGTTIALPGLGLVVAGPIIAALAGGGAGAVAGGVVGGLVGLGIPESNVNAFEEALKNGGVVLGVEPHSSEDASDIKTYFEEHDGENIVYA